LATDREQLARILAVRVTKRAAIRLRLAALAAEARETELAARQAAAKAAQITAEGLRRIQDGRGDILSGPFPVNAIDELRQTVAQANARHAAAQVVVREATELAEGIERERQIVAHNLLTADRRCERLEDKLKELKAQFLNKRDERDIEDFASTQVALDYAAKPTASAAPFVAPFAAAIGGKTEVSELPPCPPNSRSPPANSQVASQPANRPD
jgi:hypothetical protein